MRVVIVGGVAAGMSAATRLRRLDEHAEIVVLERGPHVSFANCGLPYVVGGVIPDRSALLRDADAMARRSALDIRRGAEVLRIDRAARTVRVRDGGGERDEPYDRLLLAQGAVAAALPGDGSVPVHPLRTIEDMDALTALVAPPEGRGARRAVIAGAGYIGLETAENLVARGLAVTIVTPGRVLRTLDPEMSAPVVRRLRERGIALVAGRVARVAAGAVLLDGGGRIDSDLVVDATGIAPDVALARAAGLTIGPAGGIAVDDVQVTSDPAILAAGDAAEKRDAVDGEPTLVALAGLANRHGRAAADTIAGTPVAAAPALGVAIVGVLGLTVATFGWTEQRLVAAGRAHRVLHTHPSSHAAYYPGAAPMALKLLIDADTDAIVGAQIVGTDGVDTRIDVLAVAAAAGVTASALSRLELAYAPQYGSAKDPVNLAGYVAENLAAGTVASLQWHELAAAVAAGAAVVDVRSPAEFARGAIPGAVNLPVDELRERHRELSTGRIVLHCQVGQRGFTAARMLTQLGHDVVNLDGGYVTWRDGTEAQETAAQGAEAQEGDPA